MAGRKVELVGHRSLLDDGDALEKATPEPEADDHVMSSKRLWVDPVDDKLVVRQVSARTRIGRIHVPETAVEAPQFGVVLTIGPGMLMEDGLRLPMPCKQGEMILYGRFAGAEVELGEAGTVLLLRHTDVLGILREEDEDEKEGDEPDTVHKVDGGAVADADGSEAPSVAVSGGD